MSKLKLLTKRDIDVAKAKDRQREIDEGSKLAKRVDGLRQLAADEQASLESFRVKTLSTIQSEIDAKVKQKEALDIEIQEQREERERLLKPLDDKWQEVTEKEAELGKWEEKLEEEDSLLQVTRKALAKGLQESEDEAARLVDERQLTEHNLTESQRMRNAAVVIYETAQSQSNKITVQCAEREIAVAEREHLSELREKHLGVQENELALREKNVINRERAVRDKYQTLIRNEQRI